MDKRYQLISPTDTAALPDSQAVAGLLAQEGQLILPFLDLIEQAQVAIDEVVDVMGRATIEAVLQMSAAQLAGPKQQGKKAEREIVCHGTQKGRVALKERQLHVTKPRLRKRKRDDGESGEVETLIPTGSENGEHATAAAVPMNAGTPAATFYRKHSPRGSHHQIQGTKARSVGNRVSRMCVPKLEFGNAGDWSLGTRGLDRRLLTSWFISIR